MRGARSLGIVWPLVLLAACGDVRTGGGAGAAPPSPPLPCPPQCESTSEGSDLFLTHHSMAQVRTAAWQQLLPFAPKDEGLPDSQMWTPVTSIFSPRVALDGPWPLKVEMLRRRGQAMDLYESTFLNTTATDFVKKQGLNVRSTTDALKAAFTREIEMPAGSKALKMFFYRVRQQEKVYVRLWDWNQLKARDGADLDDSAMGAQCVQVVPTSSDCLAAKDSFYTITVDDTNKGLFTCGEGCGPAKDDVLILVGMHITSKQTPEWLWATFWWRGKDRFTGEYWTCQDAQRPPALATEKPWQNYSMDATASLRLGKPMRPEADADRHCGLPPTLGSITAPDEYRQQFWATYNPFVEAGLPNGLKSTCVNCHARSTTRNTRERFFVPPLSDVLSPHLFQFEGHIRLDYLWSLGRTLAPTSFP